MILKKLKKDAYENLINFYFRLSLMNINHPIIIKLRQLMNIMSFQ